MSIHTTDVDHCDPFDKSKPDFWMKLEHLGRYLYAAELARNIGVRSVLDAACASGYGSIELAKSSESVTGLDFNDYLLEMAEEKCRNQGIKNVNFVHCDLEKESFYADKSGVFDFITCFETLEHLINPEFTLSNFHRLLKTSGVLLVSVPNSIYEPKTVEGLPRNPFHKHMFTPDDIKRLILQAGFKIEKVLAQQFTNVFFNREKKMIDNGLYEKNWVNNLYNHSEEAIRYFSKLFAIPEEAGISKSYSVIIQAKK